MKRSSNQCKPFFRLGDFDHQLNMYALAASAAGVGVLASAGPSEAKIVYTPAHHVIGENEKYFLALNHKTTGFLITNSQCLGTFPCTSSDWALLWVRSASTSRGKGSNEVVVTHSGGSRPCVAALKRGAPISKGQRFDPRGRTASEYAGIDSGGTGGPWVNATDRYLGLKFKINGKSHYGWARLNVTVVKHQFEITATLTGYAYETIPNKAIIAGKTKGPDVTIAQRDTLGGLALGKK